MLLAHTWNLGCPACAFQQSFFFLWMVPLAKSSTLNQDPRGFSCPTLQNNSHLLVRFFFTKRKTILSCILLPCRRAAERDPRACVFAPHRHRTRCFASGTQLAEACPGVVLSPCILKTCLKRKCKLPMTSQEDRCWRKSPADFGQANRFQLLLKSRSTCCKRSVF